MRSLMTYRPYSLFNQMERNLGRMFDDSLGGVSHPSVSTREEEDRYVVEAELAGLTEKDILVKVENDILTLSRTVEEEKEEDGVHTRRHSSFKRSFYLPTDVDAEKIEASLENGLLVVALPKSDAAKPRQIEVKKA